MKNLKIEKGINISQVKSFEKYEFVFGQTRMFKMNGSPRYTRIVYFIWKNKEYTEYEIDEKEEYLKRIPQNFDSMPRYMGYWTFKENIEEYGLEKTTT